ncbi:hypothetical protein SARI_01593 [Salmonella enterica subsp. arizonae serovar 62:z4,z23:-]|uniref:Uncharacterized protein n=1 Tax=Salmonella arizonae (strain ATCC BAA-731 / CDC346-86 / RSK2980) TaxID=41514 RepID=A9MEN0_SALAR|nr:hypothetical protein SARI_01593 [Salmonella enterica subsp. arizonae serovar 62:z4,z23:-]
MRDEAVGLENALRFQGGFLFAFITTGAKPYLNGTAYRQLVWRYQ